MYSFLAQQYYKHFDLRVKEYKQLFEYFCSCKKILDIGCGIGDFCINSKKITGVDHNRQSLTIAKKRGCKVVYGDVLHLPFRAANFDGVFCAHVIEHFDPLGARRLLSEINRVLKKKGILVLQTPLMHKGFYNDFTHEKVYTPEAIMHYLSKTTQTNLKSIGNYKVISLQYRRPALYTPLLEPSRMPSGWKRNILIIFKTVSLLAYFVGLKNYFSTDGYILTLQKQ